jgi:parallel beta-helix repeat protein
MRRDHTFRTEMLIGMAAAIGWCGSALANDIHVCSTCAHTTIQSAVDSAASGDTVYIAAGRYTENITIAGKALTIRGVPCCASGVAGSTTVFGLGRGPVFTLGDGGTANARNQVEIYDLTISGGNHPNGSGEGGGIQVRKGAYLHLFNSTVAQNIATSGGGVGLDNPGNIENTITDCLIENNTAVAAGTAGGLGGGVAVLGGSVFIFGSTLSQNRSSDGGGVYAAAGTVLDLEGDTLSRNTTYVIPTGDGQWLGGRGGGVFTAAHFIVLSHDVITENSSAGRDSQGGGGIYINAAALSQPSSVDGSIIARNTAVSNTGAGIAIYGTSNGTFSLSSDYVLENSGSGVFSQQAPLTLTDTILKGNSNEACVGPGCPN